MTAERVVAQLLEADPDDVDPRSEVGRYSETIDFDRGAADLMQDARKLFKEMERIGILQLLKKHKRPGSLLTGFGDDSIAQAIIQIAIEKRGSRGAENAYKFIRRHGQGRY